MDFLRKEGSKFSDLNERYIGFGELYQKKLWHQLTVDISSFVLDKNTRKDRNYIDLYNNFIKLFEDKMNQLKFVQIASVIAQQFCPSVPSKAHEVEEAIIFMKEIEGKKVWKDGKGLEDEAMVVARMAVAELLIRHGSGQNRDKALEYMKDVKENLLPRIAGSGAETIANSSYYRVACEYYRGKGPADEFYKAAIQFLAYTSQDILAPEVQKELAIEIGLTALVGETVYNFGEVLAQPVLKVLDGSDYDWLGRLLYIFHNGDIDGFAKLCEDNQQAISGQPLLKANMAGLKQKIGLLCLMKLIFERPPEERNIDLDEIAEATRLESEHVEWLLMRAMSKGLIKGKIDGVEREVQISLLKPRVLDMEQLEIVDKKLTEWTQKVQNTIQFQKTFIAS
mmetsp:Transcript_6308/g.7259  ORF Transcript_6308/g.7259 Transcript_6308/m.7259 type:complete len:395 (-) Transcript_6308:1140-2324(-)|eukprot:CAMPEP_0184029114 /NCGR_PEP_ID=MMETSP0955-20130417/122_1 /TAXON_ID=627963 /ORGANISM="Aplanochytrium sp, Strain PBS07" /LENGTH=394 /DNA_ID=CAMNT_0026314095 /DNA_START=216 /DNA_END=1400 /DNA_ORIENTATION=-